MTTLPDIPEFSTTRGVSTVGRPDSQSADEIAAGLVDGFGRRATDLRVSLTDRCNLRCTYCMPAEGLAWLPRNAVLSADEIVRLIRIGVEILGIEEVRFTGGEPLVRADLVEIVRATAQLRPAPSTALTTNGLLLARHAQALADAGLHRVNVSLDTLDPQRFRELTRRDRHADVIAGMAAAQRAGLTPVKVNAVLMRGVNDDEAGDLLDFCLEHDYSLRFIEQMPLDADRVWSRESFVTAEEILDSLSVRHSLTPVGEPRGAAPAERFLVDGGPATVGLIASVSRPFCRSCDRTRVTADGQVRSCLFSTTEHDLRSLLRDGSDDAAIARAWQGATALKQAGHGVNLPDFVPPERSMSAIGG